jgi:hypothetical protein
MHTSTALIPEHHRSAWNTVAAVLRLHGDPCGTQATDPTQCATAQLAADGRGERRCRGGGPAAGDTLPGCQRGLEGTGRDGRQLALAGGLVGA